MSDEWRKLSEEWWVIVFKKPNCPLVSSVSVCFGNFNWYEFWLLFFSFPFPFPLLEPNYFVFLLGLNTKPHCFSFSFIFEPLLLSLKFPLLEACWALANACLVWGSIKIDATLILLKLKKLRECTKKINNNNNIIN